MNKRQLAMTRSCPQCGAASGSPCKGVNGNGRKSVHALRLNQKPNPLPKSRPAKSNVVPVGNATALARYGETLVYDAHIMREHFIKMLGLCGSPIEGLFLEALVSIIRFDMSRVFRIFEYDPDFEPPHKQFAALMPQAQIGPYRVDFLLKDYVGEGRSLVIECDGHEWHERTKDQATRDKKRDRYLVNEGHAVMRFTGTEIHQNAGDAANEVLRWLKK